MSKKEFHCDIVTSKTIIVVVGRFVRMKVRIELSQSYDFRVFHHFGYVLIKKQPTMKHTQVPMV